MKEKRFNVLTAEAHEIEIANNAHVSTEVACEWRKEIDTKRKETARTLWHTHKREWAPAASYSQS